MLGKLAGFAVLGALVIGLVQLAMNGGHLTYPPGQAPGYHYAPDTICPSQAVCAAQWKRELAAQQPAGSTVAIPQGAGSKGAGSRGKGMGSLSRLYMAHRVVTAPMRGLQRARGRR